MARQKHLLTVWNPYFEPHTIQVHAKILRQHQRVWWARLYMGTTRFDEAGARERYPAVAEVADEALRQKREFVLFATNFQVLHALRVERVVFGSALDPAEAPYVPPYYQRDLPHPAVWFLVRDIRALAYNQLQTLRYFLESGELASGVSGYDPYAAFLHNYPIAVGGPPVEELFDPKGLRGKARLYVDHSDTVFAPEIVAARRELERLLAGTWERLEEKSQAFLATSWVVYQQHEHTPGFDLSAAFAGVARAVETEVCEGVIEPLLPLVRSRAGAELVEEGTRLTLGSARHVLEKAAELALDLRLQQVWRLHADRSWNKWLRDFADFRNGAVHRSAVRKDRVQQRMMEIVAPRSESRLEPIVTAKEQLRELLRAQAREEPLDLGPLLGRFGKHPKSA